MCVCVCARKIITQIPVKESLIDHVIITYTHIWIFKEIFVYILKAK